MQISRLIRNLRNFSSIPPLSYLPVDLVQSRVLNVVHQIKSVPEKIPEDANLVVDLRFDSMLRKEFYDKLEAEFCVPIPAENRKQFVNVYDTVKYFASNPKSR